MRKKGIKNRYWLQSELDYLKDNYGKIKASDIALHLNTSERRVINKAYELDIKSESHKLKRISDEERIKSVSEKFKVISFDWPNIKVVCPLCGNEFSTKPYKLISGHTKTCGCSNLGLRKGTNNISKTFFNRIKRQAEIRKIEFDLDIDYLEDLLIKQNFQCALSKVVIVAGYWNDNSTASLDRIDPSIGYIKNNVQWLHKDVNMCKQSLSNKDFIDMCVRIANARTEYSSPN